MKKVLLIAYYWRGRMPGLAKYLPEFGWQPVILTTPSLLDEQPSPELRIIETPYHDVLGFWKRLFRLNPDEHIGRELRKRFGVTYKNFFVEFLFKLSGAVVDYPDLETGWKPFAIKAGNELLQQEDIDVILSSSSPVTSHLIAKELKVRYKTPWLADFRDLWSQNHNYSYGPLRRLIDRRLEVKTLSTADALITVSQPWVEKLGILHKGKPAYAITNGFDPAEINTPPVSLTAKFTITYSGTIYTGKQDPSKFFAALGDLISTGTLNPDEVEVRFYGKETEWLGREIKQYGLSSIVKQYGMVPRQVALEKQRESQVLLLLNWDDPQERGVYTGKIFEYLAARRPILATGGSDDVIKELLDETHTGIDPSTVQDIKKALEKLYQEYKLKGGVAYTGIEAVISKYSHREMARKFAEILNHLA